MHLNQIFQLNARCYNMHYVMHFCPTPLPPLGRASGSNPYCMQIYNSNMSASPGVGDTSNQPISSDTQLHHPFFYSEDMKIMEVSDDELDMLQCSRK